MLNATFPFNKKPAKPYSHFLISKIFLNFWFHLTHICNLASFCVSYFPILTFNVGVGKY